jgi:hypothetical protein
VNTLQDALRYASRLTERRTSSSSSAELGGYFVVGRHLFFGDMHLRQLVLKLSDPHFKGFLFVSHREISCARRVVNPKKVD